MTTRAEHRKSFAEHALGCTVTIQSASSDASFRSYWRVTPEAQAAHPGESFVIMDAPPDREDCAPFLDVQARLNQAHLYVPQILARDAERGFLLLSDLGTQLLLSDLNPDSVDGHYQAAMHSIVHMQRKISCRHLSRYDAIRLQQEMALLPEWFLELHLGVQLSHHDRKLINHTFALLEARALSQEQAFVHRDFHSRNLMIAPGYPDRPMSQRLAIIDFQDAVLGPASYDLVSLLRDCYIRWPEAQIGVWRDQFLTLAIDAGLLEKSSQDFAIDFDWMGVQRHIKVLGIFARLNYRDGKSGYLKDLPLVLDYTLSIASIYPELQDFAAWLQSKTTGVDLTVERI